MYEQYTDKQIVEMLVPKLNKAVPELDWNEYLKRPDDFSIWNRLISVIYKSGYIRGQLGRSFIIGEKKEKDSGIVFQVGDSVKLINRKDIDGKYNRYYPPIGTTGKVVELGSGYCFVQWPKGVTAGDGVWACPNHFLKKVTEHWVPATKDNVKVGSKVRMIDGEAHRINPWCFPDIGAVGVVTELSCDSCKVQWSKGITIESGKWWRNYECLEVLLCE